MAKGGSYARALRQAFEKKLPAEVKEMVENKKHEIMDGNFRVDVDEARRFRIERPRRAGPARRAPSDRRGISSTSGDDPAAAAPSP